MHHFLLLPLIGLGLTACTVGSAVVVPASNGTPPAVTPRVTTPDPTPPPPETGDPGACSGTPPILQDATVTDISGAPPNDVVLQLGFIGVSDEDGDLDMSQYHILVDATVDQASSNAASFLAPGVGGQRCQTFTLEDGALELPVSLFPDVFPTDCTTYEFALYVVDGAGLESQRLFRTVTLGSNDGAPCP